MHHTDVAAHLALIPKADAPDVGFSTATPWLPVWPAHREHAVDRQSADPGSILNKSRRFIDLRARHAALRLGDIEFVDSQARVLAFTGNDGDKDEEVDVLATAFDMLEERDAKIAAPSTSTAHQRLNIGVRRRWT